MNHSDALKAAADAVPQDAQGILTLEEVGEIVRMYLTGVAAPWLGWHMKHNYDPGRGLDGSPQLSQSEWNDYERGDWADGLLREFGDG